MEEFQVQLRDGTIMKGHHWPTPNPEANYCMITGMQEYSARYDELARYLNDFHIEVWVLDAIGQGLNAPNPEDQMKWPENGFAKNVEGIHMMCLLARKNGLPTTQAGHSMGSFMTQRRLQVYPHDSDRTLIIGSNGGQACLMKMGYLLACLKVHKSNWDKPYFVDRWGFYRCLDRRKRCPHRIPLSQESISKEWSCRIRKAP